MKQKLAYFTAFEWSLWISSMVLIVASYVLFDSGEYLTLCASLIGVTSLIFSAKGHPVGPLLMIAFSILYGIISYSFSYYGEMATYLGMSGPMAVYALVAWLRNPFKGNKSEVTVNRLHRKEVAFMLLLTAAVTGVFWAVLAALDTANLFFSVISVTTSFAAVYLTARRSPYYALVYAMNDVVLIVLWVLAAMEDSSYVSVIICFVVFLVNDLYGFFNWQRMEKRQRTS